MIAELQSNVDQTLMRAEAQKEKRKRMYPFAKETFVSKKRRLKENKAKARKRRRERAERVFSAISHSLMVKFITSDHCSVIGLNNLTKRDGRWLKLLISNGKFTVDAIETIGANVSPVVLSAIDDSDDDDDDNEEEVEDGNASEGDGNGEDD